MYTLRIPSAEFATSALAASAKAGYLGAVLLLARRLDSETETELRDFWEDLNDITGSELLILVTGLRTAGNRNTIRSYRLQRDLFADGVAIARCYKEGFEERFDDLLSVATPTPETPPRESSSERLISAEGITEIRRGLHISERELPVILIRSNREDREMLVRLGDERCVISPVLVISEIVKHLEDAPHKTKMLRSILDSINADYSRILDKISRRSNYAQLLSRVEVKMRGRSQNRVALAGRMERALQNAPQEIREAGKFVLDFVAKPNGVADEAVRAIGKIANYLETPDGRFIAVLKKEVADAQRHKRWKYESDDELLSIQRKCKDELSQLGQIDESTWQRKSQLEGQRSEISAALSKLLPLREAHFSLAVAKALEGLGFALERNSESLPNRNTFVRTEGSRSTVTRISNPVGEFDLFLSHNSHDKPTVRSIAKQLTDRGLKVWYDEWQLPPGQLWQPLLEEGLKNSKATGVLVGKDGLGPWGSEEVQAALIIAVKSKRPVIPILLPGATSEPQLPLFLATRTWIDFRSGLTDETFDRLKWGIEGKRNDNS